MTANDDRRKFMRKAFLLLAVFGLTGSLWAADLIIGTWIFNDTKTAAYAKSLNMTPPDSSTFRFSSRKEIYKELESGLIELTLIETAADGSTQVSKITWPSQGGIVKEDSPQGEVLVETLIAPGEWYVTRMQDGQQYGLMHEVVSKDGMTLRQSYKGTNRQGDPIDGVMVSDRQ
jgi:hypothetical protein